MMTESTAFVMRFWKSMTIRSGSLKTFLLFAFLFILSFTSFSNQPSGQYIFIENKGQWHADVLFKASIPGGFIFVKNSGLEYIFYDTEKLAELHFGGANSEHAKSSINDINIQRVSLVFKNTKPAAIVQVANPVSQKFNYYYGNDSLKWVSGAKGYNEVWLREIYPNIDFRLYGVGAALKYEYVVHPEGDPDNINMEYHGQNDISIENGELRLKTKVNSFKEFQPFTFQERANTKVVVDAKFILDQNGISFDLGEYDKTNDLVIDPELVFSTYSGSFADNWSHTATFDDQGNLYAGGTVFGANFPITGNSIQAVVAGASNESGMALSTDMVIQKYSSDGSELLYSTFLGGDQSEVPHSLICNSKGELVIFGTTSSSEFPVSLNAFQKEFKGGNGLNNGAVTTGIDFINGTDLFLTVLSPDGSKLVGSTFVGGTSNDGLHNNQALSIRNYGDEFRGEVYVDDEDDIYVASITSSSDFPLANSQSTLSSSYDGVVFQLNREVSDLKWSTYIGGSDYDAAYGIRVNKAKDVYVLGTSLSSDLVSSSNALNPKLQGNADAFVALYRETKLRELTYLGTEEEEVGNLLDLDNDGNVYVFGLTKGIYPIVGNVFRNPESGQFIHSLNPSLSQTRFSTVFGTARGIGIVDLVPTAFLVNDCGNIYLAGWGGLINSNNGYNLESTTTGLPISSNAYRKETTGSNYYFAIFEENAKSLLYATYFGSESPENPFNERGDHLDGGTCRFDKNGIIYHSACVCRGNDGLVGFPTENGFQKNHNNSNCNMAAFKFDIDDLAANFDIVDGSNVNPDVVCAGTEINLRNNSVGALTYQWSINNEVISRLENAKYTFEEGGIYELKLEAFNRVSCAKSDSFLRKIEVIFYETEISPDTTVCPLASIQLVANGGESYKWFPSELLVNANSSRPTAKVSESTTFTVEITNEQCTVRKTLDLIVDDKSDFQVAPDLEVCTGQEVKIWASGFADYFVWSVPEVGEITDSVILARPKKNTTYFVKAYYPDGCVLDNAVNLTVDQSFAPAFDYLLDYHCDQSFDLIFENKSPQTGIFTWDLGIGDSLNTLAPVAYTYAKAGDYTVRLKATNEIGCTLEVEKVVNIPEKAQLIPNAISPNGDGKNETFVIAIPDASLNVYNRWGKLDYENPTYDNSWGTDVESGTYFYELKLVNGELCKGWVEVFK
ncbi:DUF7948 domain-containing protein [Arcticibacterium luteifluviistationis]|uniref:PKD domain-containing protein n=1 Tax=Arcticibacterium luteifluviistationis TaxID=1784714 RepID=A0A2Z4GBE9_9BACT|nr:gliding motility-associated C-terminal domain-containing protein [Arcticibacterium luteifluviistationis]AWV98451.1 PKD domain-containing protein [Arcticibacterium luteifluviistationis]